MKKTLLILFLVFAIQQNKAQDIVLTFDGLIEKTSENAPLDKVTIENVTTGKTKELTGSYSINLTSSIITALNYIEPDKKQQGFQSVFPNPFNDFLTIDFYSDGIGLTHVSIYNIKGQTVATFSQDIEKGVHRLVFSPDASGIYIIGLYNNGQKHYSKVIASQNLNHTPTLRYSYKSESSFVETEKAYTKSGNLFYQIGDVLKYTGYSGGKISTVYASPTSSDTTTFSFTNPYYRFEPYLIEANIPSFVDIMFSVTDSLNRGVDYLTDSLFKVYEDDKEVSPTETFMYVKKLNQVPFKQKTVIMLDNSASVAVNLAQIKSAAISLVNKIAVNQEIAVYSFSDNAVLLQDFTSNIPSLEAAINGISTGFPSTNLYGSLITGLNSFKNTYSLDSIVEGYLIALTDGDDTQGSSTLPEVISARGNKRVFMVGLGKELTEAPLKDIAYTGAYTNANTVAELNAIFDQIHLDIIRFSKSFYWLNYMSPKRGGSHTLTLEVDSNTNANSDSIINGSFPADIFQSVYSGVYANITAAKLYGVDWVNLADADLSSTLKATTYWAKKVPEYAWNNDNPSVVTMNVNPSDSSKMILTGWSAASSETATITLTDVPNNFTKEIEVFRNTGSARVHTKDLIAITNSSVTISGLAVPSKNNNPIIEKRGMMLTTSPNTSGYTGDAGDMGIQSGPGKYSSNVTNLLANTTYYSRAYIVLNNQFVFANEKKSFTTLPGLPNFSNIFGYDYKFGKKTRTSAYLRTILANDGGDPITEKGFVYGASPNPTLATASKVTNADTLDANGSFESNITGLTPDVDYYARGFATNSYGTAYTYDFKFRTALERAPYVILSSNVTKLPTSITIDGNIIYDGGSAITSRGMIWSTKPNPTIALTTKTMDGVGSGSFTSSISGLQPNRTYYVRAYATNTTGTAYSGVRVYTTPKDLPTISTMAVTNITSTNGVYATANSGIVITSDGGSTGQMNYGICWDTVPNPTISGRKTVGGTNNHPFKGEFAYALTGLELGLTYYVRAYVTNEIGTTYGNELTFKPLGLPYVSVNPITSPVYDKGTTITGHVWAEGGLPIIEKGVCWSTTPNPTIALTTKTLEGSGTGGKYYNSKINGPFVLGATYYVKAYATNQFGTGYSSEVTFIPKGLATVTTAPITNVTVNNATGGGMVTSDGGYGVSRGVCWGTSPNPTATQQDNFKSDNKGGTGSFTSIIDEFYKLNVQPGSTVYVRAYARNQAGIAYGNEVTFITTTPNCGTVTDIDGNIYPTITIRDQCWMQKNLDVSHYRNGDVIPRVTDPAQWANLTTGAWCYYENNTANGPVYGKLYNWYAVNDTRGLAPSGWHVASNSEWITLRDNLSYVQDWSKEGAGDRLKETGTAHWLSPNSSATNVSGFLGLPGGLVNSQGFSSLNQTGGFWTHTQTDSSNSTFAQLNYNNGGAYLYSTTKLYGFSVRCIKNSPDQLPSVTTTFRNEISTNTAKSGGNIQFYDGSIIVARGICWSTSPNPVVTDNKTTDGNGIGDFVSNMTGLVPGTLYYVRAYATKGNETTYGDEFSFATDPLVNCNDNTTPYSSVVIGTQRWMDKNLNVCTYRNGDLIPQITDPTEWYSLTSGAWCYYELNSAKGPVYGKLYNWYAVNDPRGLAPEGWHVPTKREWDTLVEYLGGQDIAGGKMKQTGTEDWLSPNSNGDNSSGFTALPGGLRGRVFDKIGESGSWWSSTVIDTYPRYCLLNYSNGSAFIYGNSKTMGFSVRCIKD